MLAPTHIAIAHASYLTTAILIGHQPRIIDALLITVFAIFPADLDTTSSIISKVLKKPAEIIEYHFGHRTITHSLLAQVLIGTPLYFFSSTGVFISIMCAWVSHSWADMMTSNGVQYFYPSMIRCVMPDNEKFRFKIMGNGELILCWLVSLLIIPLHGIASKAEGTRGIIQSTVRKVEWTREQYDKEKGRFRFYAKIEGSDNLTLDRIDGKYQIIVGLSDDGFLLLHGKERITACQSNKCDWYIAKATLERGQPESTTIQTIKGNYLQSDKLLDALQGIDGQVFLIGKTKSLKFHYDTVDSIPTSTAMHDVDITIQIRHAPSISIKRFPSFFNEQFPKLNPLIEKWLLK